MNYSPQERQLLKALCLRGFAHRVLKELFVLRRCLLFCHKNSWQFVEISMVNDHIYTMYELRDRQRGMIIKVRYKYSEIYKKMTNIYHVNKCEIRGPICRDLAQNHSTREYSESWGRVPSTSRLTNQQRDDILGELCLKQHFEALESAYMLHLENAEDEEARVYQASDPDEIDESSDDDWNSLYLPYGNSDECHETLQQIREEIQNCQQNLLRTHEKFLEDFEEVQNAFETLWGNIEERDRETHLLEDHEIKDDDALDESHGVSKRLTHLAEIA